MAKKKKSGKSESTRASLRAASSQELPPLPDRRAMERIMRELVAGIAEDSPSATPLYLAQDVMYRAFEEASESEQIRLAREALEIYPDCADAFVLLAEHAQTPEDVLRLYEQGVVAGRRTVGEVAFEGIRRPLLGSLGDATLHAGSGGAGDGLVASGPPGRGGGALSRHAPVESQR